MRGALILDASLPGLGVAWLDVASKTVRNIFTQDRSESSAVHLAQAVANVLRAEGMDSHALQAEDVGMIVGTGPGSFTGIRLALGFCHGVLVTRQHPKSIAISAARAALGELAPCQGFQGFENSKFAPCQGFQGFPKFAPCQGSHQGAQGSLVNPATATQAFATHGGEDVVLQNSAFDLASCHKIVYIPTGWDKWRTAILASGREVRELTDAELMRQALTGMGKVAVQQLESFSAGLPQAKYLKRSTAEEKQAAGKQFTEGV